ncbi:DUF3168 domain-containing protein [Sphingomonas sp. PB2P19]|uniref:tail completion protein gp17 n=1 Tax=Sphingomonas rhamnosi TaxID=3096156 RepID=UPI002FC93E47
MIEATLTSKIAAICPQTYPVVVPKGKKAPFVTYTRVSTPRLRDFNGPTGMAMPTFRVDAYALDFDEAKSIANRIRLALDGYRDAEISDCNLINEQDLSDLTSNADLTRIQLEFKITHSE